MLFCAGLAAFAQAPPVHAELPLRRLVLGLDSKTASRVLPKAFENAAPGVISLLVTHQGAPSLTSSRLVRISPDLSSLELPTSELPSWVRNHPDWRWQWAPPRRLLLDNLEGFVHARAARTDTGLTGQGAIVGIVDSGVDLSHPDLRHADGSTRVKRLLDFSTPPRGIRPDLEDDYGCTQSASCSVLTHVELDALLADTDPSNDPTDSFGHGTHVASLAVGNGTADSRFVGIAPEADLIVARVTRSGSGGVLDADVLRAVSFIFAEAAKLGQPAVVNLSLGSDFGPHDGSSALEEALAKLVGPNFPGRSIVVAAGNSGGLYSGVTKLYPEPFGIHTEAFVPSNAARIVPLLSPHTLTPITRASVYVWLSFLPEDDVAIGLDDRDGPWITPVAAGAEGTFNKGGLEVTILNGKGGSPPGAPELAQGAEAGGAVVILDGQWPSGSVFGLRLVGHGNAQLWLESSGELSPGAGTPGALFPSAQREGTISIPAAQPDLIAVGASTHRTSWTDYRGSVVETSIFGLPVVPLDSIAGFSAAGPNAFGDLKPEIVAPGLALIGALSRDADPRSGNVASGFGSFGACADPQVECFVASDRYAVSAGTSMSAPLVAGAVALLLERNPKLTQPEIRALLIAGARQPTGNIAIAQQAGPGILDAQQMLRAQGFPADTSPLAPSREQSWFSFSSSFVRPSGRSRLALTAHLKDAKGAILRVAPEDISLNVTPGALVEPLSELGPGVWQAAVAADPKTAAETLHVNLHVRGNLLLSATLPIAVDYEASQHPLTAKGGCSLTSLNLRPREGTPISALGLASVLLFSALRKRRCQSGTRADATPAGLERIRP